MFSIPTTQPAIIITLLICSHTLIDVAIIHIYLLNIVLAVLHMTRPFGLILTELGL